jgi:hypothetical protein
MDSRCLIPGISTMIDCVRMNGVDHRRKHQSGGEGNQWSLTDSFDGFQALDPWNFDE